MPAKKAARQSIMRAERNRSVRTATRTGVTKALRSMGAGELAESETDVILAVSLLDRAVQKGVLHKHTASRRKSRLAVRLNRLKKSS